MTSALIAFVILASGPLGYQAEAMIRTHLAASAPCLTEVRSPQTARLVVHVRTSWTPTGVQVYSPDVQAHSDGTYYVEAVAVLEGRTVARASGSAMSATLWVTLGPVTIRLPVGQPGQVVESTARQLAAQLRNLCSQTPQAPVPEQDQDPASRAGKRGFESGGVLH